MGLAGRVQHHASARPVLELEDHREVAEPHGEEHLEVAARLTLVRMMAAAEDPGVEGARGGRSAQARPPSTPTSQLPAFRPRWASRVAFSTMPPRGPFSSSKTTAKLPNHMGRSTWK